MCESPDKAAKRFVKDAENEGKRIGNNLSDVGKNIERNAQNIASGSSMIFSGDWNNADRTLLDISLGTVGFFQNPDETSRMTGKVPAKERKMNEATTKSNDEAAAAVEATKVAEATALTDQVKSLIRGVTENQRRTPGRALTLLGEKNKRTTLLG